MVKKVKWTELLLLLPAFAVFTAILIPIMHHAPWEIFDTWRQSDTYSIAQNYYKHHTDIFHPELNYDGTGENYVQLELQIVPWLSAKIFRTLGYTSTVVPRSLSTAFFLGAAVFLYLLLRRFFSTFSSFVGLCVFLFLPLSLLIANSIQPESCALFFYTGGIFFIRMFQEKKTRDYAVLASLMIALAILEKTPTAFAGLLFLYVFFSVFGIRALRKPLSWICVALALGPWILFTAYTSKIATFRFVNGIASKHVFTSELLSFLQKDTMEFFYQSFADYFGWGIVAVSLIGFLFCLPKKKRFLFVWGIAFLLETLLIASMFHFAYYLVFLLPVCAAFVAAFLEFFFRLWKPSALLFVVLLVCLLFLADRNIWEETEIRESVDMVGTFIDLNTQPDESIAVLAGSDPSYLNAANRTGYRANIDYYDSIPSDPEGETRYFREHGVRWFVIVIPELDPSGQDYAAFVQTHYSVLTESKHCVIYDLYRQTGA